MPTVCPWDQDGRWGSAWGELTSVGMRMHFLLGSELRQRYFLSANGFGADFNVTQAYSRSTDLNRTILSAQSQLMGLFPPSTGPMLADTLAETAVPPITVKKEVNIVNALQGRALPNQFQAFPVHVFPYLDDYVLLPNAACHNLFMYVYTSQEIQQEYDEISRSNPWLLEAWQEYIPLSTEEIAGNISYIADSIACNQAMSYKLPQFSTELLENTTDIFNRIISLYYQNDLYVRYFSSWFFRDLASHLEAVLSGSEPTKFRLYSAHDTTVAGILAGLLVFDQKQPPFASALLFEVSEVNGDFTIRVTYNDAELTIGPCLSPVCPLQTFIDFLYLRAFVSEEVCSPPANSTWSPYTEGHSDSIEPGKGSSALTWVAWIAVVLCALTVIGVVVSCVVGQTASYRQIDRFNLAPGRALDFKVIN